MTAIDALATDELQELAHRHLLMHFTRNGAYAPGGNPLLVLERGEGPYVFDTDGRRYLDGLSSLFCCQLGYSFGEEMAAVAGEQLSTLSFNTNWGTAHPPAIRLATALAERAPGDLNRVFFTSGGSESVEAAWKIVRQHYLAKGEPQRTKAIAREIAYHGVTLGALSFTGVRPMKEPFGAAPIPVVRVSNTNAYRSSSEDLRADLLYDDGRMLLHGITFGGHPVSAAIALLNIEIFEREGVLANVRRHEDWLRER